MAPGVPINPVMATVDNKSQGQGGYRLSNAMDDAATLPALIESVVRVRDIAKKGGSSEADLVEAVESDAALAIAVIRHANNGASGGRGGVTNIPDAIKLLSPGGVLATAEDVETYHFFQSTSAWADLPERFRRHALATRHAAERITDLGSVAGRDELALAALLHDIGTLVLARLYPAYDEIVGDPHMTPEDRVGRERRELGIDHALVGGVLSRRWGLPGVIAAAIERHHTDDAGGLATAVRLADMVAHHAHGEPVEPDPLRQAAEECGLSKDKLTRLLYEFPYERGARKRPTEPSPLSNREADALRGLADGRVYKEIAEDMGLSASTVRTHLHNVYRKLGAADRAQAVLIARERGWI